MRGLFTDGANSAAHFGLGFAMKDSPIEKQALIGFLVYQFLLAPDGNAVTDTAEYLAGGVARTLLDSGGGSAAGSSD